MMNTRKQAWIMLMYLAGTITGIVTYFGGLWE